LNTQTEWKQCRTHNNRCETESFKTWNGNLQWPQQSAVNPLADQIMQVNGATHHLRQNTRTTT